jgi:transposase-like protein
MPLPSVDLETKQQGQTWLLPPYLYSLRQIASELDVGLGTVQKWRQELALRRRKASSEAVHTTRGC